MRRYILDGNPVSIVYNHGFKPSELKMIEAILEENEEVIAEHWNRFLIIQNKGGD
jgi:hypothetical protein